MFQNVTLSKQNLIWLLFVQSSLWRSRSERQFSPRLSSSGLAQ